MQASLTRKIKPRRRLVVRQPTSPVTNAVVSVISVIFWLFVYQMISWHRTATLETNTNVPSLMTIIQSFGNLVKPDRYGSIWLLDDFKITGLRIFIGLGFGTIISVFLGISMACFGMVRAFFLPILSPLAKIPQSALIPIIFVIVGIDIWLFITLIAIGVLPVLSVAVYQMTVYDVPDDFIDHAYSLGASHGEVIIDVIFPTILPRIIEAVRSQFGSALQFLIASELFLAPDGVGYRLRMLMRRQDMASISDYLIVLVVVGFLVGYGLTLFRKIVSPWFDPND